MFLCNLPVEFLHLLSYLTMNQYVTMPGFIFSLYKKISLGQHVLFLNVLHE